MYTGNLCILDVTYTSNLTIPSMWKKELLTVYLTQPKSYAKNLNISAENLRL
jgi:hypothetical protein